MSYQHLTLEEQSMIAPMRILGWSIPSIACHLSGMEREREWYMIVGLGVPMPWR